MATPSHQWTEPQRMEEVRARMARARTLHVQETEPGIFAVYNPENGSLRHVNRRDSWAPACDCEDHDHTEVFCKHRLAVGRWQAGGDETVVLRQVFASDEWAKTFRSALAGRA